jgi:DNA polymerase-3 subunit delta
LTAGKPLATLLRENRVWGPRERLIGPALTRVTEAALERALSLAAKLDRQVKGLSGGTGPRGSANPGDPPPDPWDGMFELAMTIASSGSPLKGSAPAAAPAKRPA